MPGMNSGLNDNDPILVAAFKAALLHQGLICAADLCLGLAWLSLRAFLPAAAGGPAVVAAPAEPAWRRMLRIGFGILWIFDGILQAQPKMPAGLPAQVIEPTAATSPALGPAPRQLGRDCLVVPSHPGGRSIRVDPGRHRHMADRRPVRLVPEWRGWSVSAGG